jgi:hypothetical protein
MTRKDYIIIANALFAASPTEHRSNWDKGRRYQFRLCVFKTAEALRRENPRFDFGRFFEAVGLDEEDIAAYQSITN